MSFGGVKDFTNLRATRGRGMSEISSYSVPSGFRADLHARPEGPSLMGWMDGWDGVSKVSFNFLHTLWVYYIHKVYTYLYM